MTHPFHKFPDTL